jgi:serine/threonine protein kinase
MLNILFKGQPDKGEIYEKGQYAIVYRRIINGKEKAIKEEYTPPKVARHFAATEFHIMSAVQHPYVASADEIIMCSKTQKIQIIMPFAETDLEKVAKQWQGQHGEQNGAVSERNGSLLQILTYLHQAVQGLRCLHHCGYLHLDVSPGNILIFNGVAKIADFSLSVLCDPRVPTELNFSSYSDLIRPPELRSGNKCDINSDAWAFGMTMAATLCGGLLRLAHIYRTQTLYNITVAIDKYRNDLLYTCAGELKNVTPGVRDRLLDIIGSLIQDKDKRANLDTVANRIFDLIEELRFGGSIEKLSATDSDSPLLIPALVERVTNNKMMNLKISEIIRNPYIQGLPASDIFHIVQQYSQVLKNDIKWVKQQASKHKISTSCWFTFLHILQQSVELRNYYGITTIGSGAISLHSIHCYHLAVRLYGYTDLFIIEQNEDLEYQIMKFLSFCIFIPYHYASINPRNSTDNILKTLENPDLYYRSQFPRIDEYPKIEALDS